MGEIVHIFKVHNAYFLLCLLGLFLILLISNISLSRKMAKLNRQRQAKLESARVEDIIDCLTEHSNEIERLVKLCDRIEEQQDSLNAQLGACIRNVGIVRFNAFEDVGGEQSFALALLDADKNGALISNLHGRHESRLYVKRVINGESERALSGEEKQALEMAMGGRRVSTQAAVI